MTDETRTDVKINGDGSLSGGTYGDVTVNGAGTINGDIDCTRYTINGAASSNGRVKAGSITVNGQGTFNGEVQATSMTVNGDASIRDGVGISQFTIKGNATVGGSIAAHDISLRGFLKGAGDCQAESFTGEGAFNVAGLLSADTIDVKIYGTCSAKEIGGEKITIRSPQGFQSITQIFTFWAEQRLTADTIEGDDVYLEGVTAKTVRGRNVTIGSDCKVDVVEYSDNYSRTDGAMVGEARRVDGTVGVDPVPAAQEPTAADSAAG
jgi:cytoskeletal protein CcmA (bactofilin family)